MTPAREIPFVKLHGLGNDYIYLDARVTPIPGADCVDELRRWARTLAHRRTGIGSDGLIILRPDREFPCRMEMYNADGSRAEMCGNGIRGVAQLAWQRGYARDRRFVLRTDSGPLAVEVFPESPRHCTVRAAMGMPHIEEDPAHLEAGRRVFVGAIVALGNPHFVVEVPSDLAAYPVAKDGPLIERHARFPHRTNVEFVTARTPRVLELRVWERGSGETDACGTGATAAVAALYRRGRLEPHVTVELRGGELQIDVLPDGSMAMTGPSEEVFSGAFSRSFVHSEP